MCNRRMIIALFGIYAVMAIVTFGHAAAKAQPCGEPVLGCTKTFQALSRGITGGILWPFYWSWEAWS